MACELAKERIGEGPPERAVRKPKVNQILISMGSDERLKRSEHLGHVASFG